MFLRCRLCEIGLQSLLLRDILNTVLTESVILKMKAYLFDFDGTLVDSMPAFAATMIRVLEENNVAYPADVIKIITPLGYIGTAEYFIQLGLNKTKEEIISVITAYLAEEYRNNIPVKSNVISVLKELKSRGADLNVLTASPHVMLDPCLKRLGVYDLFTNVWSCEDFNTTKSNPDIYKMAAEKIGLPITDVLFLDDNYNADKTAKSAGMPVCGVYDLSSDEYTEEIKSVSDYYIRDFKELLDI